MKISPKIEVRTGPQFATSFVLRPQQFAWLLGSGASASAGVPSGYAMIADFRARLFCQLANLPPREVDATDPLWMARMDEFFGKRSILPPPGDPSEYAAAFEAVYPAEAERRRYIEDAVRKGTPSFAHRVLASMITTRTVPCVFTTNFDQLIETAATITGQLAAPADRAHLTVAALDSVDRAERCLRESSWPLLTKLHGDYQSIDLKNTARELASQDEKLRGVLVEACQRFGLIIVGYSGRDASVMEALNSAVRPGAFSAGIYWVTRSQADLYPSVVSFLNSSADAGVATVLIESQNFDELAGDVADLLTLPKALHHHVYEARPDSALRPTPLPVKDALRFPVLQCSALSVLQMPTVARRIALVTPSTTTFIRQLFKNAEVRAIGACNGREVAAFGPDEGLLRALRSLGPTIQGTVRLDPDADSWALGLMYDALVRSICFDQPLFARMRQAGHFVLVGDWRDGSDDALARVRNERLSVLGRAYSSALVGSIPDLGLPFFEGVRIRLESVAGRWWCAFDPATYVEMPPRDESVAGDIPDSANDGPRSRHKSDPAADWRRERWARRYNGVWSRILDAWSKILSRDETDLPALNVPEDKGIDAVFRLSMATAWSRPAHEHPQFARPRR
jgi:hypothetical protein